jgi:hypothetical protein
MSRGCIIERLPRRFLNSDIPKVDRNHHFLQANTYLECMFSCMSSLSTIMKGLGVLIFAQLQYQNGPPNFDIRNAAWRPQLFFF